MPAFIAKPRRCILRPAPVDRVELARDLAVCRRAETGADLLAPIDRADRKGLAVSGRACRMSPQRRAAAAATARQQGHARRAGQPSAVPAHRRPAQTAAGVVHPVECLVDAKPQVGRELQLELLAHQRRSSPLLRASSACVLSALATKGQHIGGGDLQVGRTRTSPTVIDMRLSSGSCTSPRSGPRTGCGGSVRRPEAAVGTARLRRETCSLPCPASNASARFAKRAPAHGEACGKRAESQEARP